MDTHDAIEKRSGCRKYAETQVDREQVGLILDAGRLAPSAGNLQDRSFVVVKDAEKRKLISEACGNQAWMTSAPIHIVVIGEHRKTQTFYGDRGEKIYAIQDTAFATENMLLTATNLGLGSSLVVGFNEEKIAEITNIKAPARPYSIITIGHAAEEAKPSTKYPLERFVFFEEYGRKAENPAVTFGDFATARKQFVEKAAKETVQSSKGIFEKIKGLFKRKKQEIPSEDHFLEEKKESIDSVKTMEKEIPRQLPKH